MKIEQKTIDQYLERPYTVTLRRDEEGDWVARVQELEGCTAHGATKAEALENLEEVQRVWIADALEAGDSIPTPQEEESLPSGKWLQRTPRSLHGKLVAAARHESVSLNQLVTSILAEAMGKRSTAAAETIDAAELDRYDERWSRGARWCGLWNENRIRKLLIRTLYLPASEWEIRQPAAQGPLVVWQNLVTAHYEKAKVSESGKSETVKKEELRHKAYYANV